MSCNPAIGGVGKGHLVREVDALGGLMGVVADQAGIHFRVLNRTHGTAVRGPRAQCDKALYESQMASTLRAMPGVEVRELRQEGARYTPLERMSLGGGGKGA